MLAVNYYNSVGTPEGRSRLVALSADPRVSEAVRTQARQALSPPGANAPQSR